jgi:hypothetical protein
LVSPEDIARQQQVAAALQARASAPAANVGQGLTNLGAALGAMIANRRASSASSARQEALVQAMQKYGNDPQTLMQVGFS